MTTAMVYGFKKYDIQIGAEQISPFKATEEAIKLFQAVKIPGSEESVNITKLDEYGRYDPRKQQLR